MSGPTEHLRGVTGSVSWSRDGSGISVTSVRQPGETSPAEPLLPHRQGQSISK